MYSLAEIHALADSCPYQFPHPSTDVSSSGLIALGGDLSVGTLVYAYTHGLFPWFNDGEPIAWWCPNPRCVMIPQDFRPAKSLVRTAKKSDWTLTINHTFDEVMHACSLPRSYSDDTWIHDEMKSAYHTLHTLGIAVSIEIWEHVPFDSELVGGLYGVQIGQMFFGESMFHRRTDASKLAFWGLNILCTRANIALIDCQLENSYLLGLGASLMTRDEFLTKLDHAMWLDSSFANLPKIHKVKDLVNSLGLT
ncbi:MAG: leucyl/phenylalanyl-tRNA--protein transferase [Moraxella sp.]|nr:leucyl/phenylalanyl-tRNA--protein transferase [Moraxella sp.]